MRGALFNALGDITGLTVLDAFAGSGALSFEAISRGAASALAIEVDRTAQKTIIANARLLHVEDKVALISAPAAAWLQSNGVGTQQFDLLLLDPPYDNISAPLIENLLKTVRQHGLAVISWPTTQPLPTFTNFRLIKQQAYGDGQLVYYRLGEPT